MSSYFFVSLSLVVGSLCLNFDIFRNTVPLTDSFTSNSSDLLFIYLFIYQLFWTQACPVGMFTNGAHRSQARCHPCPIPQPRKVGNTWPGLRPPLFSNSDVGSFTSHKNKSVKVLWDGTYGFSSLSEKTRKSNHLQMSLQRQHFLLSFLKCLSVGSAGVWTRDLPLSRPALSQLS